MVTYTLETTVRFNNGMLFPFLSLGTCDSSTCETARLTALNKGYRSIDTAVFYGNEEAVGVWHYQLNSLGLFLLTRL